MEGGVGVVGGGGGLLKPFNQMENLPSVMLALSFGSPLMQIIIEEFKIRPSHGIDIDNMLFIEQVTM